MAAGLRQTYNNEFMIINMGLFTPGSPPPKGTLFLLDQVSQMPPVSCLLSPVYCSARGRCRCC